MRNNSSKSQAAAIQGGRGSFHHIAAGCFAESGAGKEVLPCADFKTVVSIAAERSDATGIMAIENSLAGSLLHNYTLLDRHPVSVTGEVYLRIHQNLLTLPGKKAEDLREVHSHPMALAQCDEFLSRYRHIRLVETEDTAMSAEELARKGKADRGAIASKLAAELFGLEIAAEGIENNPENYTRFLLIRQRLTDPEPARKASLSLELPHARGTLYALLGAAADAGFNLTKIQSMPVIGSPGRYRFYLDVEHETPFTAAPLEAALTPHAEDLQIHGIYTPGKRFDA